MRIKRVRLRGFKRFDDLTIDLGDAPDRVIALVGPNGCGKSSVFDAFEEKLKDVKGAGGTEPTSFYTKFAFHPDPARRSEEYRKNEAIEIVMADGSTAVTKKSFHLRSPYRFTPTLSVENLKAQPDILDDPERPRSSIAIDSRLRENYERLLGLAYEEFESGNKTGGEVKKALVGRINKVLSNVLDVRVSSLGNVTKRRGQLYFEKEDAKDFPYQNLSSGEKEVIDVMVDLIVRTSEYDDTVYCIDEPELHLNSAIQRKLLNEVERLIPTECQLWVATHSIGFLRALQDELRDESAILDFSEGDYFQGAHTISPMPPTRPNWQRVFGTALDDLVGLVAPARIVYCEGRADPALDGTEQGLDAFVYNEVFSQSHDDTLFISSGGTGELRGNSSLALRILRKAFRDVELLVLRDRDTATDPQREAWLAEADHHRMLVRQEIENYLLDYNVLEHYCSSKERVIERTDSDALVTDLVAQDLKADNTTHGLKVLCGEAAMTNDAFKRALASHLVSGTATYRELEELIFG